MDLSDRYDAATALKESGDPAGAVVALEAILADHPDHVLSHSALAVYLVQVGREDDAVAHAVRVTELDPDDAFAFIALKTIDAGGFLRQALPDRQKQPRVESNLLRTAHLPRRRRR